MWSGYFVDAASIIGGVQKMIVRVVLVELSADLIALADLDRGWGVR